MSETSTAATAPALTTEEQAAVDKQLFAAASASVVEKLAHLPPSLYQVHDVTFGFKSMKGEDGKPKPKRPAVKLAIPYPTFDGVVAALMETQEIDGKEVQTPLSIKVQEYVIGLIHDDVTKAARTQVGDEEKPVNSQDELDVAKLTLAALATVTRAERTGGGIAKETWEAFGKDYTTVMVGTGLKAAAVGIAVDLLLKKFAPVKTNKPVLKKLAAYLDTWFAATTQAEDFQDCYEFLKAKAKTLVEADDAALLDQI